MAAVASHHALPVVEGFEGEPFFSKFGKRQPCLRHLDEDEASLWVSKVLSKVGALGRV